MCVQNNQLPINKNFLKQQRTQQLNSAKSKLLFTQFFNHTNCTNAMAFDVAHEYSTVTFLVRELHTSNKLQFATFFIVVKSAWLNLENKIQKLCTPLLFSIPCQQALNTYIIYCIYGVPFASSVHNFSMRKRWNASNVLILLRIRCVFVP